MKLRISGKWQKYIKKLEPKEQDLIYSVLDEIESNPYEDMKQVQKYKPNKVYRRVAGDYRILYSILKKVKIIDIVKIGNRRNVYD